MKTLYQIFERIIKFDNSMDQKFGKKERLKGEKSIEDLFKLGKWQIYYPLKIIYIIKNNQNTKDSSIQIAFSVPKKIFKKAVDRNKIKRLLRAHFRVNKDKYYQTFPEGGIGMIIYTGKNMPKYQEIAEYMSSLLEKIKKHNIHNK